MSDGCVGGFVPAGDGFSVAELGKLPGRLVCELVDGVLVAAPHGGAAQQAVVLELGFLLRRSSPAQFQVMVGPVEYQPDERTLLQPDVLVCHAGHLPRGPVKDPVQLVIEVVSETTRTIDQVLKKTLYERAGVPAYWLFEPDEQVLTVLELAEGKYVETAVVKGGDVFGSSRPFPVRVTPSELVRRESRAIQPGG
ncbi:Uma2 family endonuclease [Kribbella sp. DT2]|uniref:Uma2 family endonuclease n=1 Tax=Kribbella sp. DT2 TaxID=3393427 RepID=UPI003CEBF39D